MSRNGVLLANSSGPTVVEVLPSQRNLSRPRSGQTLPAGNSPTGPHCDSDPDSRATAAVRLNILARRANTGEDGPDFLRCPPLPPDEAGDGGTDRARAGLRDGVADHLAQVAGLRPAGPVRGGAVGRRRGSLGRRAVQRDYGEAGTRTTLRGRTRG